MAKILFLGNLGVVEIVLIALIVLLLFGGRKIPELMKGIGRGIRSFKEGARGDGEEPKQKEGPHIGGIGTGGRTFRRSFRTPHTKMRPGRLHGNGLVSIRQ